MCLPSDTLLQHLPSYLDFSYLGRGVSLHGCSSKVQSLLLTLDKGYLLTTALPELRRGIAPLGPPAPAQPLLLGLFLPAAAPDLGCGVAPPSCRLWPPAQDGSSWPLPLASGMGYLFTAAPAKCSRCSLTWMRGISLPPPFLTFKVG